VATCGHVISVDEEAMKEGFLVAVDEDDQAIPVIEVLANNPATDSAILRLKTDKLQPLALSRDVVPGDPVYCFSDPLDRRGVFTNGIVNRFMQRPFLRHEELTPEQKAHPDQVPVPVFIQVSTDWAPGSSGSAVLDQCGNAMGHVSEVQTELDDSGDDLLPIVPEPQPSGPGNKAGPETVGQIPGTVIVFHDAIAASNVRALIKPKVPAP
jgi:S1-C subfamily serine protease